ncbi:unnamed protein product [Ranitomeya imitator]|uniref:alkaline phosphatase n=1 Tax=Ranitomeya imitator TaxID=111125 RepID=A0ABN9MB22_9NEOB|nr:unnamed protein product [Ranitomeya imitator]
MKWAFEEWRHWLEGAKHRVVVLTDHKNLTYLESAKRLNPRQARWSLFFSRFDFVVSYLPGSKNVKADALSRSFVPDSPGVPEPAGILKEGVILSAISPDLRQHVVRLHGIPENIVSDRGQVESSDCPGVDTVVDRLQQIWTHVVDNLTLSQEKAQRFANRRRCVGPRLRVGDLVWLSSCYVPMKVSSPKFKPRFIGPYKISEVLNPVSFRLTLPASFAIHNVFHRSLLRRYVAPVVPSVDPPAPVLVEGEFEYVVEKILDSCISRRKLQYLVKWKGYGQEDNSWVFASDVHAADLLAILIVVLLAGSSGTQRERLRTARRPLLTTQGNAVVIKYHYNYLIIFKVILGGGRKYMTPKGSQDPEYPSDTKQNGLRNDGRNLINEWLKKYKGAQYVWNKEGMNQIKDSSTTRVMGLFEPGDMKYELNRNDSSDPSIVELTEKAIKILKKNPKGFYLFVEDKSCSFPSSLCTKSTEWTFGHLSCYMCQ